MEAISLVGIFVLALWGVLYGDEVLDLLRTRLNNRTSTMRQLRAENDAYRNRLIEIDARLELLAPAAEDDRILVDATREKINETLGGTA